MKALFYAAAGAAVLIAGAAEAHQAGARYNAAAGYARGPVVQSRAQTWYSDTGWQGGYGPIESYGYGYGYGGAGVRPPVVIAPSQPPIQHGGYAYSGVTRSMPFGYPVDGYGRYPWARAGYGGYGGQYQGQYQGGYQQGYYQGGYGHDCGRCGPPPQPMQPVHYRAEPIYVSQPPVYVSQPPVYVESPPVFVQPAPVYVEPARVHVAPPPVHVAAADVRVAPAQVEVARPNVYVEPPRIETAPPVVNFDQGYYAVPPAPPAPPSPTERPYRQERGERG
ncbi:MULTISPECIES: hypothetical protein [Brevundimonas]|uniref:hypothetical protein n=1 Tax=Brevundimonas sp. 357 TaxID=2555782 RepID=UPI000F77EBCF|nr:MULTISPECIES: hypothetical protein [Brevundimonas]RSB48138.1 hypothetical protein EGK63_01400 [Brevundimonas sp. 357]